MDRPKSWNPPARLLSEQDDAASMAITASPALARLLNASGLSLALTSYQAGRLYMIGSSDEATLTIAEEYFHRPMGLAYDAGRLWVMTTEHVLRLNAEAGDQPFSHQFKTKAAHKVGAIHGHDLALDDAGRPVFAATRHNAIATIGNDGGLEPLWTPSFIDPSADGDRCHLNGLAMQDGAPAFATAFAVTNRAGGWRSRKQNGGIVFDIQRDGVITTGLSMPHSPRLYDGQLWVCNSGSGEFGFVDLETGRFEPVAFCPGFVRGLAFYDGYAFIGMSKPRHARFDGLPIHARLAQGDEVPWAGLMVIDLYSGETAAWLKFADPVAEFYDVCALPDVMASTAAGPRHVRPEAITKASA